MINTYNFLIVKIDQAYLDTIQSDSGMTFYKSTMINDVADINREAEVVAAPKGVILSPGDKVIIHHNIARVRINNAGENVPSDFWIEGDQYYVPLSEVFLYKKEEGDWKCLAPYTFIKPVKAEKVESSSIIVPDNIYKNDFEGNEHLYGTVAYGNPELENLGVKDGDTIVFDEDSQYKFSIDGEELYKMHTRDILAVVEE